jgi:leader peptidase (prepilin peptidase)/N-methyltransferase
VTLSWIAFVVLGTALAIIDLKYFRLPDPLTLSLACIVVALLISDALKNGHQHQLQSALISAFSLFIFYLLINILSHGGMGMGDAKLALTIGLLTGYNGWRSTFISTLLTFTAGALVGIGLILFKGAGRKTAVPFGPFMLAGCYASIWLAPIIQGALPH